MNAYRLLYRDVMERLGWRFPLMIVWTSVVGVTEGLSVVLLLPLLNRIGVATTASQGAASGLIDRGMALIGAQTTIEILLLVIIVATVQAALSIGLNWWTMQLARSYQSHRQLELFKVFMSAKWTFIADLKAGEMTNAIITESERLGRAFMISLSLLGSAVVAAIYIAISAFIAWQATLSLIGFALIVGFALADFYRRSHAAGKSLAPLNSQLQSLLDEQFSGAKFIKASAGVEEATRQVAPLVAKLGDVNAFANAMPGTVRGVLEFVALIGIALILVVAGKGFDIAPANIVIVLALFGRLFPRMATVQSQLYALNANVHAVEAVGKLQALAEDAAERPDVATAPLMVEQPATLTVRDLDVMFHGRRVLGRVNLVLPIPGFVAVVGRSGAGKSTLVHALLGLVEPSTGSIGLGDYDLASTPLNAWRRAIAYVPQETILFHASIRDNLTLINSSATEAEIAVAVRRAHADKFIEACPQGLETIIGDQGVKISGGQRQRLGIARALLAKPLLLLMDEPMSALDNESEAELLRSIEELRKEMGILIVAHRLATVRDADFICVLEAGRIAEAGTWDELMARHASLYSLVEAQSRDNTQRVVAL